MTNEERRLALALARRKALEHAEEAEMLHTDGTAERCWEEREQARMWADVAQCMKVGAAIETDGVIPDGIITR